MVTGRDATLAVMSSAVFARSAFQHDDEPIGSLICPACAQIVARSELIPERAVFPGRWAQVAELAVGVRRALLDLLGTGS